MAITATSTPPTKTRIPLRWSVPVSPFGELMKTGRTLVDAAAGGEDGLEVGGGDWLGGVATHAAPQVPQNLSSPFKGA
jgi:hypothetical protein